MKQLTELAVIQKERIGDGTTQIIVLHIKEFKTSHIGEETFREMPLEVVVAQPKSLERRKEDKSTRKFSGEVVVMQVDFH